MIANEIDNINFHFYVHSTFFGNNENQIQYDFTTDKLERLSILHVFWLKSETDSSPLNESTIKALRILRIWK